MQKIYTLWLGIIAALSLGSAYQLFGWGTNNRADPFPLYTTIDPQEFLYTRHKQITHGWPLDKAAPDRVSLSFTGFGQAADSARKACGATVDTIPVGCTDLPIGDLDGRWNMIALLYGPLPQGKTYPPLLALAREQLFPGVPFDTPLPIPDDVVNVVTYPDLLAQSTRKFGYFSNALKYRKVGLRWDFEARIIGDFGFQFQGGIADLRNTLTSRVNLTDVCTSATLDGCNSTTDPITGALVDKYLMDPVLDIARELCLDICSYHAVSLEDLYFCFFWRHAHEVNFKRDASWARFLAIPFIRFGGSVPSGKAKDPHIIFSVPFTNNGHPSLDANAGINFDFTETIEIGGELGYSHFFARDVCDLYIPNSTYQSGIYPFNTTVNVQPGDTWYGAAKINAYHFIDRLTAWVQWVYVIHKEDTLRLTTCDPAFITAKCPATCFKVQMINAAFNYDISPNISLGAAWQFPIKWENAFKSNTVLFSFVATF